MSYLNTKQGLIKKLLDSRIVASSDIAFENENFDPAGKDYYLAAYFIPASTDMMGKTQQSSDEQRGIFQVSVFVSLNSGEYDNTQLQLVDNVISEFSYNSSIVYNGQKIDILNSTVNSGVTLDSWFKRDISINYLTFSER
jgi:hypothetical protein